MSIGDVAIQLAISLVEVVVNVVVNSFGLPEVKAQRIVNIIGLVLGGIIVIGLIYITFKYS